MKFQLICAAVAATSLVGCANRPSNQLTLTVTSQPAGAYITPIGEPTGSLATLSRVWQSAEMGRYKKDAQGCYLVPGYSAKWISGASSVTPSNIAICGASGDFTYVISRDTSSPGLDRDLEFALRVERQMQQQSAATSARENAAVEAAAAGFAGAMGAWNASVQQRQSRTPLRCTSKRTISGSVETVCE